MDADTFTMKVSARAGACSATWPLYSSARPTRRHAAHRRLVRPAPALPPSSPPQFGEVPSREGLVMLVAKREDAEDKMYVFFPEADVGVPHCKM
jgi:hypothetical protein